MSRKRVRALALAAAAPLVAAAIAPTPAHASGARVLRVGTADGEAGHFATIQAAVDAAHPGDWILVAPGDYRETGAPHAGVLVTTPGIHIRGLDRGRTIVDGTLPGFAPCSSAPAAQVRTADGRNGIEVLEVDGVTIENLTVCNFLAGAGGGNGNQIWWNGGDGTGQIGMGAFHGDHLTATSTYFAAGDPAVAMYGVFVSNSRGPGSIEDAYASNMADSGFYVGACSDCNTTLRRVHAENSALGYSGTNAGGHLTIADSEWDGNRAGIVPNSLASDDLPSPQDGSCPADPTRSCMVIVGNRVHDNNNPNTPAIGLTATAPIGTGIELSGSRNDTVRDNVVTRQGAWGILVNDYPDFSTSPSPQYCNGGLQGVPTPLGTAPCYFVAFGNRIEANQLRGNGLFGNPTNGDLADASIPWPVDNCFMQNRDRAGLTSDPTSIQSASVLGVCGAPGAGDTGALFNQVTCAAFGICPDGGAYPRTTTVVLLPLPRHLGTLDDPCDGMPESPWCD